MRFLIASAAVFALAPVATAQYRVVNNCTPAYVVVNRTAPCTYCTDCKCAAGVCPSCPTAKAEPVGTLRTASGRLIRQTATGYVYADEGEANMVLDCSSGRCKWVEAPAARQVGAYLPDSLPSAAPVSVSGGCANGQCGSVQSYGRQPRFAFPRK